MKYFLILIALIVFNQPFIFADELTAKGFVFEDLNGNGKKDSQEKGISDVSVSNGLIVVQTNADGYYEIPIKRGDIIFVIKPAEYSYPVNSLNFPQFHYIYKPDGSPDLKYPGTKPTGKLPKSINFPLSKIKYSDEFSIAVFSDPQLFNKKQSEYYSSDIVQDFVKSVFNCDFGVTLGDMVNDKLELLEYLNNETAKAGIPWFHVAGNHDLNFDVENPSNATETFESIYGPANYAFNHGKVHFIVLNDVIYPNNFTSHKYIGGLREEQLQFLINNLKFVPKDKLIVLMMHIPIYNESEWGETFLQNSRNILFNILSDYDFTLSLSGHTHTQRHYFFTDKEGWLNSNHHHHYTVGTASGDWWSGSSNLKGTPESIMRDGTPNGYNIIKFEGNKYFYEYKSASYPNDYRIRIHAPSKVKANIYNGGDIYVNFFQGCEKDTVEYQINNGEWINMRYSIEFDPYICNIRSQWDSPQIPDGDRPSAPANSRHIWKARLSTKLPVGVHAINVRVRDWLGRVYTQNRKFEVIEK
ncbi:MAG: calcineurin-like phosphoesterase family protein [Candidatus Kapabacteria bacterium]|nr:calcineurin-like phosphoesterase family protein [Ignavibacteriota bacterium]MCW5885143.1 calcineurin-like phosphoesterase family protein [Candidatus Kapabacteria bacterium]